MRALWSKMHFYENEIILFFLFFKSQIDFQKYDIFKMSEMTFFTTP